MLRSFLPALAVGLALLAPAASAQIGAPDASLGGTGVVTTAVGTIASASTALARPDGRIVLVGTSGGASTSDVTLVGTTDTGALDASFGTAGVATADLDGLDVVNGAALQLDGKIVVVGHGDTVGLLVARFTADGALDASFGGGDGWLTTPVGATFDEATDVAIQADGKIVVVGYTAFNAGVTDADWVVARYLADGTLDTGFGTGGVVTIDVDGGADLAFGVAIQPDRSIVVAGSAVTNGGSSEPFAAARLTLSGALDASFGIAGVARLDIAGGAYSHAYTFDVAIGEGGTILLAGAAWDTGDDPEFAVARLTSSGAPDATFGGGDGWASTDLAVRACAGIGCEQANAVVAQPDGGLVAAGFVATSTTDYEHVAVRFAADGSLDTNFGTNGVFRRVSTGGAAADLAVEGDGQLLVAGDENSQFSVTRLESGFVAGTTQEGPGWRILGAPGTGLTVASLGEINLVQGLSDEYPEGQTNLYTSYGGTFADYRAPSATTDALEPGRGFIWYFFDGTIGPGPSETTGTSRVVPLPVTLYADGTPVTTDLNVDFVDNTDAGDDDFHMLANPFSDPFAISGISVTGGTLQGGDVVLVYEPGSGYTALDGTDVVSVWQGFFAELVPDVVGGTVTVSYDVDATQPGATAPLYGRTAAVAPAVRLALAGTLASGTAVADRSALVRFRDGAEAGWDALDVSKPAPLDAAYAMVAPVANRDRQPVRLAADTQPLGTTARIPLQLVTTEAGTFELSWSLTGGDAGLPAGWRAELTDLAAQTSVDLTTTDRYVFTAEAGDWTERFALVVSPAGATASGPAAPLETALGAPRPNPSARRSTLRLTVEAPQHVRAVVYDALGRTAAVLLDGVVTDAADLVVDGSHLAPGVYVVRVEGASFSLSRSLTVTR